MMYILFIVYDGGWSPSLLFFTFIFVSNAEFVMISSSSVYDYPSHFSM